MISQHPPPCPLPAALSTPDVDMLSVENNYDSLAMDQRLNDSLFCNNVVCGDVVDCDDDEDDNEGSLVLVFSPLCVSPLPPPPSHREPTPSPPTPVLAASSPPPYDRVPARAFVSGHNRPSATVSSLADLQSALTTVGVQVRQWNWSTIGRKTREVYVPLSVGKWWYGFWQECKGTPELEMRSSHISRIMESELGATLTGENACDECRAEGAECRVYSEKGRAQVWHPGSACARCRSRGPKDGGCSVSKRRPNRRDPPDRPPPRNLKPHPGGPGPGAGGVGIMV